MKVTVKDYLNVRVGKPSVNAPTYQYLAPGSELEVEEQLHQGDKFEGVTTWLKDAAGNYYWSGATSRSETTGNQWWIGDYGIDLVWPHSKGEGVTVILLDSGIREDSPDLFGKTMTKRSVIGDDGTDTFGHGTLMSSIILGSGRSIHGVAPGVELISIKITNDGGIRGQDFLEGLNETEKILDADNNKQFVINCSLVSFGLGQQFELDAVASIKRILSHENVVLCAAAGNNSFRNPHFEIIPATVAGVIAADGLIKVNGNYERLLSSNYWPAVNVTAPGEYPIEALKDLFPHVDPQGTSHACAYTTGLVALFASMATAKGKKYNHLDAASLLARITFRDTGFPPSTQLIREKIINTSSDS
ncbi:Subtilase family protein [Chryseolinea serpens]|uniref:Subtilase family protein n=1 Tax=Chryseolinea serpens TaxID=947013 RepID=A0A1M5JWD0_9BACT|nr:S8/S53 family peptidase [Chryseolinea serpens]SHG44846.1 Subtilase family protein [Chryseolinea serpens]